ncbi:helix-turn-helix domain-containing protein [Priestia megaterium]|uniref:helix-turn-helix domain-containing protein n=1 Tax=Priestia megaterium TaxID=1404 RepID=UPI001BE88EC9|nr:helix-turn-helix transcriptional regulator [Priestia megaterium]MBT2254430.1 helix-turn-helix transcriptional regulator [Priestia megaterium]MBT2280486.1 helix-turn-helix transcriptional regulator [Priestia megaterium]
MFGYKLDFAHIQKAKGISDSELARRMKVSRSSIGYLKTRSGIDFDTLEKLCRVLEVEPKDIIVKYELLT